MPIYRCTVNVRMPDGEIERHGVGIEAADARDAETRLHAAFAEFIRDTPGAALLLNSMAISVVDS
jgi:hypothetical protein